MKYILDRVESNDGLCVIDFEDHDKYELLKDKYKLKTVKVKNEYELVVIYNTITISSMKMMNEFIKDIGQVTITDDPGFYFDAGLHRIKI